jgi:hypothetical protein
MALREARLQRQACRTTGHASSAHGRERTAITIDFLRQRLCYFCACRAVPGRA